MYHNLEVDVDEVGEVMCIPDHWAQQSSSSPCREHLHQGQQQTAREMSSNWGLVSVNHSWQKWSTSFYPPKISKCTDSNSVYYKLHPIPHPHAGSTLMVYYTAHWLSGEHCWLTAAFTTAFVADTVWYVLQATNPPKETTFLALLLVIVWLVIVAVNKPREMS